MQQHDHVECQIVPDDVADTEFEDESEGHDHPYRKPARHHKSQHHRKRVRHRIDDAVAVIVERDRAGAVALDNQRAVLEKLPAALDDDRKCQPEPDRRAREQSPRQRVEQEAVDEVRECVPVGNMLGILRTLHDAVPQLDIAAFADRRSAHAVKGSSLEYNQAEDEQKPHPPAVFIGRDGLVGAACTHAVTAPLRRLIRRRPLRRQLPSARRRHIPIACDR
jgi:hypothetical protein